jgi:hypothetical protein
LPLKKTYHHIKAVKAQSRPGYLEPVARGFRAEFNDVALAMEEVFVHFFCFCLSFMGSLVT